MMKSIKQMANEYIKAGLFRVVRSRKRVRKLRKRGELIWWSTNLNCWLWKPKQSQHTQKQLMRLFGA